MTRMTRFVPRHQFLRERQRLRMADLRYQRQLQFSQRFPVKFARPGRRPTVAPPVNYYEILQRLYGRFPLFKKLPVVDRSGDLTGWRYYRNRFLWGQDFLYLVRTLRKVHVL